MCKKFFYCLCSVLLLSLIFGSVASAALPGLIGWYTLDEGSGTIVNDSSGLGNHGSFGAGGDPQWVVGIKGGAVELDGSGDYIEIEAIADDIPKDDNFSVFVWIKTTQTGHGNVIAANNSGSSHDFIMGVENGQFNVEADTNYDYVAINDDQWHHQGYVRNGTTAYVYLDGVEIDRHTPTASPSSTMTRWQIGQEWDSSPSDFFNGLVDDVQFYGRPLTADEVVQVMVGVPPGAASNPIPENEETDVDRDADLSWTPGQFAPPTNGHRVYLSESFSDVNDGVGAVTLSANTYDPGRLNYGATYYWRVDEVNAPPDSTVYKSEVWSFTVEPIAYPIDGANITATASSSGQDNLGPENTIDGSGLDADDLHSVEPTEMWLSGNELQGAWIQYEFDKEYKLHEMWVWNSNQVFEPLFGFGMKDVTVEYSTNGTDWTAVAGVSEFAKAPGTAGYAHNTTVDFGGATAKYVKVTASSNWGNVLPQFGLSEVRFFSIPVSARKASPDLGATDVAVDATLSWRPGREAATHNVYLSTDQQAVVDGTVSAVSVTNPSYSTALDLASTYYWRIDEVNDAETPTTWQGDVWDFATQESIVVEDFEDYNDYPPHEIYTAWEDGYVDPANGSQVGNLSPPLAETTIVHAGKQSMPLFYSNTGGATYSEGKRTFAVPQNWAQHSIKTLALYFFGTAGNTGQLYVKINGVKVSYDGDASHLEIPAWQGWNIDLTALGTNLTNVTTLAVGIDGNAAAGTLYIDDIRLYAYPRELITPVQPDPASLVGLWKFDGNYNDSSGKGHNGTPAGAITFNVDPVRGQVLSLPGGDNQYVSIGAVGISGNMPRTIACWAKADNTNIPDWTLIFGFTGDASGAGGDGSHFNIGSLGGPGGVGAHVWGWEETIFSDDDALNWHHYAMSYDGTTIRYYGDGIPMDTDVGKSNVRDLSLSADRVHVGSRITQASSFPGNVDDAQIFNRVLSDDEVAGLAGRTAPFDKPF